MTTLPRAQTIRDAMRIIGTLPVPAPEVHTFPLARVVHRVLAKDIHAPFPVPGFVRSRLDGFAVRSADLEQAAPDRPVDLCVTATVAAGTWPVPAVSEGCCVRIMAGAPLPEGADAVVGFEDSTPANDAQVRFAAPVRAGAALGAADINAHEGELLAARGTRLTPVHTGVLASVGTVNVPVYSRPRVAVLSTGSELLLAGMPPSPGKIFNSGQSMICGLLEEAGAIPLPCGIARDDADSIAQTMNLALRDNSMLITTGGVGNGDYDCIREAMHKAGAEILLAGGAFRPGGNFTLARCDDKYILALSGAPGSALIILHLLGIPLVRRLTFDSTWQVREADVLLAEVPARTPQGLLPGTLSLEGGRALLHPMPQLALERQPMDLILPLEGTEDLQELVATQRAVRAFLVR